MSWRASPPLNRSPCLKGNAKSRKRKRNDTMDQEGEKNEDEYAELEFTQVEQAPVKPVKFEPTKGKD